ncbi:MAG: D-tyrosyl-tRNA(Tyr) deacylase [Sedimentisphaerales bacterium]|nr:D-tyrosyl-tRNA(Tyr) deacylase [Sedimentisphaerales bacterium]
MRAVIQRVLKASVIVEGRVVGRIDQGLLVYLSIGSEDSEKDAEFMSKKLAGLRIFADETGKMNRSVQDIGGKILLISNFALHGDCRKGRRPGFDAAAKPKLAEQLYEMTAELINIKGLSVEKGIFGAHMKIISENDGPVTFLLDSSKLF